MNDSNSITLRSSAVKNNVEFLKKIHGSEVRLSAVVKANAYGHGIEQIVPLFEQEGINHFSVFYYSEAIRVKNSLKEKHPIVIMGWISDEDIKSAIENQFEFFVFNLERLSLALKFAKEINKKAIIHLEVETGMNRSGLSKDEFEKAILLIKKNEEFLHVEGFCTHLAGAESVSNYKRIKDQLEKFDELYNYVLDNNVKPKYRHVANSAASMVYDESKMDLIRVGIMIYGFWPSMETYIHYSQKANDKNDPLQRILGWKSKVMSVKVIEEGEFIGYGISYLTQSKTKTALIPIGYSLGYSRSLSNKGRVLINGYRCGVIGLVNMNMIIADVSSVPDVNVGDEVVIIGKQEDLEIKVSSFSNISNELNYEILAHLPENITRKVI